MLFTYELLLICRWFSEMHMTRNIVTSNIKIKGLHVASGGGSSKQRKKIDIISIIT